MLEQGLREFAGRHRRSDYQIDPNSSLAKIELEKGAAPLLQLDAIWRNSSAASGA